MSIDYGMGQTNIDRSNGIRYGVISQNSIMQAWLDSSEGVYPCDDCTCSEDEREDCTAETDTFEYSGDGYEMVTCLDNDVMVIRSPFYTYAPFCSPCVPGAGNLDSAADLFEKHSERFNASAPRGVETYCVGHDWFDDGVALYPVFSVKTGYPVFPDNWYGQNLRSYPADGCAANIPAWTRYRGAFLLGAVPSDYCS